MGAAAAVAVAKDAAVADKDAVAKDAAAAVDAAEVDRAAAAGEARVAAIREIGIRMTRTRACRPARRWGSASLPLSSSGS